MTAPIWEHYKGASRGQLLPRRGDPADAEQLIQRVGARLGSAIRVEDTLARVGPAQFVVAGAGLPQSTTLDRQALHCRLEAALHRCDASGDAGRLNLGEAIVGALVVIDDRSPSEMLSHLDAAMHTAGPALRAAA